MKSSLYSFLRRYDEFGHDVGLNYTGQEVHHTVWGIIVSLAKKTFMAFYLLHISLVCINRRDPEIDYTTIFRDFTNFNKSGADLGLDVAFMLQYDTNNTGGISLEEASLAGIDESYFEVQVHEIVDTRKSTLLTKRIPSYPCLEFEKKTGRVPFKAVERSKFEKQLGQAQCIDTQQVTFEGSILKGQGLSISIMSCSVSKSSKTCKEQSVIDAAAEKVVIMAFASQNYFAIENYTDPIQAEIGLVDASYLKPQFTESTFLNVEYSSVELYDRQLRIYDDGSTDIVEFSQVNHRTQYIYQLKVVDINQQIYKITLELLLQYTAEQEKVDDQVIYSNDFFFLQQEGQRMKRKVYSLLDLLADLGGMNDALTLLITPFIVSIAAKSFDYNLVTQHMKVKNRTSQPASMPRQPIAYKDANSIVKMAGITIIDKSHKNYFWYVCCPKCCSKAKDNSKSKIVKLVHRGAEQYEKATDILSLIRLQHRMKIIESLFFNKGQRAMLGLHQWRFLKPADSDTQEDLVAAPDSDSDFDECIERAKQELVDHQFRTEIDSRLWSNVVVGSSVRQNWFSLSKPPVKPPVKSSQDRNQTEMRDLNPTVNRTANDATNDDPNIYSMSSLEQMEQEIEHVSKGQDQGAKRSKISPINDQTTQPTISNIRNQFVKKY